MMFALMLAVVLLLIVLTIWAGLRANEADWGRWWVNAIDGLARRYVRRFHRLSGARLHLPDGGVLVAANHVSGLDPLLLVAASRRPLRFLIAEEEYNRFGLRWLFRAAGCIPVDRGGRTDAAFRAAVRALKAGEVVALFPHGRIHLDAQPESRVKPGVLRLAQLANCPIVPARLEGIAGPGTVFTCLFLRSHATLTDFPMLTAEHAHGPDMRQQLGELLLGRRTALEIAES
ncbi:1-acyl-sn-glycerol-3-phosphate acyltransferase [Permianibacter sp. IMCC34836]|uniref:lysophospholipid acyltransferase family protein n=1 Tax=Permianibacter fluminis TaxID=2738515 RepID=UPI001555A873|nr:lysophospholipid acyltransferase family protein [Permianibacter fluminis]NQD38928.1 1-acyl-sn-glycerol-3-phosphate acyltransferase [Permianibacter fluminis]